MSSVIGIMFFISFTIFLIVMSFELILHGTVVLLEKEYETLIGWIVKLLFMVMGGFLYCQIFFN